MPQRNTSSDNLPPYLEVYNMSNLELLNALSKSAAIESIGGGGGKPFTDPRSIVLNGPISGIKLRHGSEIDNIQVLYNGNAGSPHGGRGGREESWTVSDGAEQYDIVAVRVRSGKRIDSLEFIARERNGNKTKSSPHFGGWGGRETYIEPGRGLVLREIRGRSGKRLDRLEFIFGYPFYIENMKIDEDTVKEQLLDTNPRSLRYATFRNDTQSANVAQWSETASVTTSSTFNWESTSTFAIGVETSFKADAFIGTSASTVFSFSFEQSVTVGQEKTKSQTVDREWGVDITLEPGKITEATAVVQEARLENVPFTYDAVFYDGNKQNVKERVTCYGFYSGNVFSENVEIELKTKPLQQPVLN